MKLQSPIFFLLTILLFAGCASGYRGITPKSLNYISSSQDKGVTLSYKYSLLSDRYAKKELKNGIKLIAVKVENNSGKDLVFGKDLKLEYANKSALVILDDKEVYNSVKQNSAIYLLYLLLTPAKATTTSNNQQTNSIPFGYALGPGLAIGNIAAASSANGNFKRDLLANIIIGTIIKSGETSYGLIGIKSDGFDAIKVIIE
jgi:hypothetical protein